MHLEKINYKNIGKVPYLVADNINSKQMSLRYIVGRKPTLLAKVFVELDSIIVRKRIIKNLIQYKYNVMNIYNLYI